MVKWFLKMNFHLNILKIRLGQTKWWNKLNTASEISQNKTTLFIIYLWVFMRWHWHTWKTWSCQNQRVLICDWREEQKAGDYSKWLQQNNRNSHSNTHWILFLPSLSSTSPSSVRYAIISNNEVNTCNCKDAGNFTVNLHNALEC